MAHVLLNPYFATIITRYYPLMSILNHRLRNINEICCHLCRCKSVDKNFTLINTERTKETKPVIVVSGDFNNKMSESMREEIMKKYNCLIRNDMLPVDVKTLSNVQIDSLIMTALELNNMTEVEYILSECSKCDSFPSLGVMECLLMEYSNSANVRMVNALQEFYGRKDPNTFSNNSDFGHYLARSFWMKGNIERAFEIFIVTYECNRSLKRKIRTILRDLISDTVRNGSGASIMIIKRNVLCFVNKFRDYSVLGHFWKCCWESEMYADQKLAEELFDEHKQLRLFISDRIPIIASFALKDYQEDSVVRLLQTLLKHDMKFEYMHVIRSFFDYKFRMNDIRGCTEIVENCSVLKISLGSKRSTKYLRMLITEPDEIITVLEDVPHAKSDVHSYKFKF